MKKTFREKSGESEATPKTRVEFTSVEPTALPNASELLFFLTDWRLTLNSGRVVPMEIIVAPIMVEERPRIEASETADFTTKSAETKRNATPTAKKNKAKVAFCLVMPSPVFLDFCLTLITA